MKQNEILIKEMIIDFFVRPMLNFVFDNIEIKKSNTKFQTTIGELTILKYER